jgi:predicted nucleic acid-binding protein
MIVADTNIISYLLLPTSYTELVDDLYQLDSNWVAPILWKSEFRNVLALYLRKKIITLEKALQLQEQAESIMARNEYDVSSSQVLALINESACSAYDCEFVALSHHLNTRLITQDKKILKEFPSTAITVSDYLARYTNKP